MKPGNWFCVLVSPELVFTNHLKKEEEMLAIIGVILIVLWLLGMVTSYTMGGFIHILLVIAVVVILIRVIRGNKVL